MTRVTSKIWMASSSFRLAIIPPVIYYISNLNIFIWKYIWNKPCCVNRSMSKAKSVISGDWCVQSTKPEWSSRTWSKNKINGGCGWEARFFHSLAQSNFPSKFSRAELIPQISQDELEIKRFSIKCEINHSAALSKLSMDWQETKT